MKMKSQAESPSAGKSKEIHSTLKRGTSTKKNKFVMSKHYKTNTSKNTGSLWTAMVDTIRLGNPVVIKGVVAVGIVMMVVTATHTLGQLFQ